jgi:hypothetical protein
MRLSSKELLRTPLAQRTIAVAAAEYLRLVWWTTRFVTEPPDVLERYLRYVPIIVAMWHGQHFLMPFTRPAAQRAKVLISRHRDGEINAIIAERLGVGTIRGSGTHGTDFSKKGGVTGFQGMLNALEEGYTVALTADIPKVARKAGLGIIKLAQHSGRPIVPIAVATRRRIVLNNWDHTTINLPFGLGGGVAGLPIYVPADADDATLELARRAVEDAMNAATSRAYELADGTGGDRDRG